jgi:hypothetical protein
MKQCMTDRFWKPVLSLATLTALVAMTALATTLARPTQAGASTHSASGPARAAANQPSENCQIVLDKLRPGERSSRILSQQCVPAGQPLVAPQGRTLLMTWYSNANLKGARTNVYGKYGPCDSSGYVISNTNQLGTTSYWGYYISSYRVFSHCYWSTAFSDYAEHGVCRVFAGNVNYVGYDLNDHVFSFHISNSSTTEFARCGPA